MTSSAAPSSAATTAEGGETSPAAADGHSGGDRPRPKVVSHVRSAYKIGAVYWRRGLPENGKLTIADDTLSFKGILGKHVSLDLASIHVEKASSLGGLVHDSFIVSVAKPNAGGGAAEEGKEYRFSTGMRDMHKVVDRIRSAIGSARLAREKKEGGEGSDVVPSGTRGADGDFEGEKEEGGGEAFEPPAPDPVLPKMELIAEKRLRGVRLRDYSEVAWSDERPIYKPFLEQQGKNNVTVLPWQSGTFEGGWCGETYAEERVVAFDFLKQTIGQTLVEVKHTQRKREEDGRCVVQIKMEMKGFPYADCFAVHVRHVASRDGGGNDLRIQIGMHVEFLKSCLFEKKIRNNTGAETTKAQLALLEMTLKGCAPYAKADAKKENPEDDEDEGEGEEVAWTTVTQKTAAAPRPMQMPDPVSKAVRFVVALFISIFRTFIRPYVPPELLDPRPPSSVEEALRNARASSRMLEEMSLKSAPESRRKAVSREIVLIAKSIDRIEKMTDESNS